jgi:hypothetical protein
VFRQYGWACVPRSAGAAGMCEPGTPALAQRERFTAGHRARAGAQPQWDQNRSLVEPKLGRWKSAATIGRHRNPSPDRTLGV